MPIRFPMSFVNRVFEEMVSFSRVPGNQLAVVRENHSILLSQPYSFASENDPTPILWPATNR
jgi:hypothetical protein